ncbi:hypothetical protein GCM10007416_00280 [Kroppenstedtia guangzhouensis]|jgi:hypothetical protein|uniref:Uncharacterized protein n=1 Tax=Kroppenstedtia guangzhouensis TaxID=1274356 RepID=A0ABQ1FW97_9BACL|nr:hypothetical protein GCM10007416_00280 [Kroppenstedtia guangzhouensis]
MVEPTIGLIVNVFYDIWDGDVSAGGKNVRPPFGHESPAFQTNYPLDSKFPVPEVEKGGFAT